MERRNVKLKLSLTETMKAEDETLDTFYLGRIFLLQKRDGYRFSVDAPLLADFIKTKTTDELLELGTGNGVISLLLSLKPFKKITAIEIQEALANLAKRNVILNKLEDKINVVQLDLRQFHSKKKFDVIFSNPPYIKKKRGQLSPLLEKSIAKHELKCDIFEVMKKTAELLRKRGKAYFIFPASREDDFRAAVRTHNLRIKSWRYIFNYQRQKPILFLAECNFRAKRITILPPLILYDKEGNYTQEARAIFSGRKNVTVA